MPPSRTQAFTLPELLMILAIIGILAVVLLPNLIGARRPAYDVAALVCPRTLWQHAIADHLDTPTAPFATAQTLMPRAPACLATPQLTIQTQTTLPTTFQYTVFHPGGRNLVTVTLQGVQVTRRP
jgi:type IV pilus assembly protein PilA